MCPNIACLKEEENLSFVREHFDTEVAEGLMTVVGEEDFWAQYGREAAISAIAVIYRRRAPRSSGVWCMTHLTMCC